MDLSRGAISTISEGASEDLKPVLQVMEVRLVNTAQTKTERFRMVLSDGVHQQQAMLATQMNHIVQSGALQKGSIVQLNEFICNSIQGRRIIIVINLDVLAEKCDPIGDPINYHGGNAAPQARAPTISTTSGNDQGRTNTGTPQSYGGLHSAGPVSGQNMMGGSTINSKPEPALNNTAYGNTVTPDSMPSRNINNVNSVHPKADPGSGNSGDLRPNGGIHNQRLPSTAVGGFRPPGNTYGRPALQTYQQPPPMYMNRGPVAKNEAPARIVPIAALNPYQGRWTIKARVTSKGEVRRYSNARGEGKVFNFELLDSEGGEIRVTCFNLVVDQFYDQIEAGKVYLISKGTLKPAQKTFNHLNNEYEIVLDSTSTIQQCLEEDNSIPRQQFNFRPISEIESMENNSTVDIIGIVASISTASSIMTKRGTETCKRTLQLKDMSGRSVEVTLWGNFCGGEGQRLQDMCDSGVYPVLGVKNGKVNDFSGKSVGTSFTSQLFVDPDFPEAHRLKEWFNREGKTVAAPSISRDSSTGRPDVRKTVSQIKDEGLGRSEKPDWITVKATVSFIKSDNFFYTACPLMNGDRQCNKKVNNNGDGSWHCDRCDRSFPECDYRYLLQFQIQDHTGMTWVTAFQESGEELMGISAKELCILKTDEQDEVKFAEAIRSVLFTQYLFKLKVKEETFSDEQRVKSTVIKAEKVNPSLESRYLLGLIEKLSVEAHGNFAPGPGMANTAYGNMEYKSGAQPFPNTPINSAGTDRYRVESANHSGLHASGYGGAMGNNFGNREAPTFCNNCGSTGHNFQNCPSGTSRQGQSFGGDTGYRHTSAAVGGGNSVCYKCQQPGHFARDCPGPNSRPSWK
ncbi:replication protein A 70 kDa DNA-binding subunit A-like [Iris pallida]|uniref:Replication protein A subunit n=1 Tax=Iris pallida TaxID=29817 RepID=A0AAX6EY29_IRIPA|nr:replication protein A 70 kDa DNA-binding subunit A-like [Iris pallida]